MRMILFTCGCGKPLSAVIIGPATHSGSEIRFYTRSEPRERITICPNCQRDFSRVTVDEFLTTVWPSG